MNFPAESFDVLPPCFGSFPPLTMPHIGPAHDGMPPLDSPLTRFIFSRFLRKLQDDSHFNRILFFFTFLPPPPPHFEAVIGRSR